MLRVTLITAFSKSFSMPGSTICSSHSCPQTNDMDPAKLPTEVLLRVDVCSRPIFLPPAVTCNWSSDSPIIWSCHIIAVLQWASEEEEENDDDEEEEEKRKNLSVCQRCYDIAPHNSMHKPTTQFFRMAALYAGSVLHLRKSRNKLCKLHVLILSWELTMKGKDCVSYKNI